MHKTQVGGNNKFLFEPIFVHPMDNQNEDIPLQIIPQTRAMYIDC